MLQSIIQVLTHYGYKIDYSPYHTDADIKKYASRKDRVSKERFFTIYTPEGYVVGRIHTLKENGTFDVSHLNTIIGFFKMFEIPHRKSIIEELEEILTLSCSKKSEG